MGSSRRDFLRAAGTAGAIGLASFAGCVGTPGEDIGTITYGGLHPLSGPYGALGKNQRAGANLAVEHVSESDEFGFEMEAIHEDTQLDPATGTRKAQKLVQQDGTEFLVGGFSSSVALALNQFALDNEVIYSPIGVASAITGKDCNQYVFRASTGIAQAAHPLAAFAVNDLGSKVWFHIADYSYGESVRQEMKSRMEKANADFEEVGFSKSQLNTSNYNSFITQIGNSDAEIVVLGMAGGDMINFIKQAHGQGLKEEVDIVATTGTQLLPRAALGPAAYGVYGTVRYRQGLDNPENNRFVEDYRSRHDSVPDTVAATTYLSVKMVANGIEETGSSDPTEVKEALPELKMDTILGETYFRACDHEAVNPVWMGRNVEPAEGEVADLEILKKVAGEDAIPPCSESDCKM